MKLIHIVVAALLFGTSLPLPPSPPGKPLIGHFDVIPAQNPEFAYIQWGKQFDSDILYFNVLGRHIIVLNSVKAANDLLDKRGANYASRPRFVQYEVMGWGITLTFLRWGPRFKLHRKLLQSSFTASNIKQYRPIQQDEARRAVKDILSRPDDWEILTRRFSTAVVMRIGFGVSITKDDDPYIQMADDANHATTNGGTPASTIVDFFPLIRFLPNWLARSAALRHAREAGPAIQRLHDTPWAATEKELEAGTNSQPSFMRTYLEKIANDAKEGRKSEITVADIKGAAGAISIAGGNTTWSTIVVFILNMLLNPHVQKKVQAELDAVVGPDRLPTFEDRDHLKYLDYCIQETYRWAPLSPVGVPHASIQDDEYKGYFIPKGSVVYANARAMTHDESVYKDPGTFNPDRYIPEEQGGAGEPYPQGQFGFGRRACPGRHLASAGVYIAMATILATMNIVPKIGQDGKEVPPVVGMSNGLSSHPDHFDCDFKARTPKSEQLLRKIDS
ncbi:cytochrome P450 [Saccharata proteae CBS 121410]|uniref:Cytochrome P450 n=1 Tax=Saccharata proteae CBS 121410 TaxID=1314787 RepID=A0A9P4HPL2_9PEZI|nr:cytochrome P450 [Saccharata proteae CBS 121410]